jgi:hypothetical protein
MNWIILCDKPGLTASSFRKTCVLAASETACCRPCLSTGPLNQSEGVTRQPIEVPRIGLASGVLQCIDSSAAKPLRILKSLGTIQVGHCS